MLSAITLISTVFGSYTLKDISNPVHASTSTDTPIQYHMQKINILRHFHLFTVFAPAIFSVSKHTYTFLQNTNTFSHFYCTVLYFYHHTVQRWMLFPAAWPVSVWGPAALPARPAPAGPGTVPTGISSAALPAGRWSRWSGACAPSSVSHWPSELPRLAPLSLWEETVKSRIPVEPYSENVMVLSPSSSLIL